VAEPALEALLAELEAMPRRDREAVLASLSAAEREQVSGLVRERRAAPIASAAAAQHPALSDWLTARLGEGRWEMTAAARQALAEAIGDAAADLPPQRGTAPAPRPSLLGSIGGWLAPRRRAA
jgi:hypothetical protein